MHHFDLLPDGSGIRITGSTRAALMTAAIEGLTTAEQPMFVDDAKPTERPFEIEAATPGGLLVTMLAKAAELSQEHNEAYRDIKFTLVTDKEAKGAFLGLSVNGFGKRLKPVEGVVPDVAKNVVGQWEARVTFES